MKRMIQAADDTVDTRLIDKIKDMKEDFDYILSGLEKMDRLGVQSRKSGLDIADELSDAFQSIISEIADTFTD